MAKKEAPKKEPKVKTKINRQYIVAKVYKALEEKGIAPDTKKTLGEIIKTVEETVIEVCKKHPVKFLGGTFKRRFILTRVYGVPTVAYKTLIPGHWEIKFSKSIDRELIKGKILEDGRFLPEGEKDKKAAIDVNAYIANDKKVKAANVPPQIKKMLGKASDEEGDNETAKKPAAKKAPAVTIAKKAPAKPADDETTKKPATKKAPAKPTVDEDDLDEDDLDEDNEDEDNEDEDNEDEDNEDEDNEDEDNEDLDE